MCIRDSINAEYMGALKEIMSGPLYAALIGFMLCAIPPLRNILINPNSFIKQTVMHSIAMCGRVVTPVVLFILGGSLTAADSTGAKMSGRTIGYITLIRLVLMPIAGVLTILAFYHLGFLKDPMLMFVIIITYATPSAINLLVISTQYQPDKTKDIAKTLVTGYVLNIMTLPIVIYLFLSCLQLEFERLGFWTLELVHSL
eukprot:TRINITY_DN14007_c0_g1_i1.p1 TRINITY_DN14007_c0_g1~~TRINITY_DN14007_c0_g1_i1.p1  ORF type:complete len:219 (-),score=41.68 TRINITY_DN14007_c0_g1_i1:144-743(-)